MPRMMPQADTQRSPLPRPQADRRALRMRRLAWRGVFALAVFGGIGLYASGLMDRVDERVADKVYRATAALGLRVADVALDGREFTNRDDVLKALNVTEGSPTLAFDPAAARAALEALPCVASAEVERRLPGTIIVHLTERAPMAIWQHDGHMVLIDHEGVVLGDRDLSRYGNLPMVVGEDAPKTAAAIIEAVAAQPALAKRVSAYIRVGDRRWDLKLDNDVEIKLPETGTEAALRGIALAEAKSGLLERDVLAVDMRLSGKMIVETSQPRDPKRKIPQQQGI